MKLISRNDSHSFVLMTSFLQTKANEIFENAKRGKLQKFDETFEEAGVIMFI